MSCLETICVCSDDDLTTSIMFKFCIADAQDEYQYVNKYQYRLVISMIFDCIFFPLILLGILVLYTNNTQSCLIFVSKGIQF